MKGKCKTCSKELNYEAASCPNCGDIDPFLYKKLKRIAKGSPIRKVFGYFIIIIIIILVIIHLYGAALLLLIIGGIAGVIMFAIDKKKFYAIYYTALEDYATDEEAKNKLFKLQKLVKW